MEGSAQAHLQAARAALKSLDDLAMPEGASLSGAVISQHLRLALNELSGVDQQIAMSTGAEPEVARVPCSFCGKPIMPMATLCGFCWHRREPT